MAADVPAHEPTTRSAIQVDEARLAKGEPRFLPVERLRVLHERAARLLLDIPLAAPLAVATRDAFEEGLPVVVARRAEEHLAAAERFQWEIGSWASGAGEGLASVREARELGLARGWLLVACAREAPELYPAARALADAVDEDLHDIARDLRPESARLRAVLDALAAPGDG